MKFVQSLLSSCSACLLLAGCSAVSVPQQDKLSPAMPAQYYAAKLSPGDAQLGFETSVIDELYQLALSNNQSIQQQALQVRIAEQQLTVQSADLLPSLAFTSGATRAKNTAPTNYNSNVELGVNLTYELDLWGKLDAQAQQASFAYLQAQAEFEQVRQQLLADVTNAWVLVIQNQALSELYTRRVEVAQQNLATIETGYKQGLNEALDVYLTRNDLQSERARLAQQRAVTQQAKRNLQRLLGDYPSGQLIVEHTLPNLTPLTDAGIPSDLMTQKPSIQSAWYQLLGANAAVAIAHKQRYPSLTLTARTSASDDSLADVISTSSLAWSLAGNLTAPLFNAGRLAANEESARLSAEQRELAYINVLLDSFNAVENALEQEQALQQQYQATLAAKENAEIAEKLSFEQYRSGLVTYTTVLAAQTRAYEARSSLITLHSQRLQNRVNLYLALGRTPFAQNSLNQDAP